MVEVSSLRLCVTHSEKDKGGWWLMTQKDTEREKPNIPPTSPFWSFAGKNRTWAAVNYSRRKNKAHFQKGLVSMTQLFQRT